MHEDATYLLSVWFEAVDPCGVDMLQRFLLCEQQLSMLLEAVYTLESRSGCFESCHGK